VTIQRWAAGLARDIQVTKINRFIGVGTVGFLVDASVFFGLTLSLGAPYAYARISASLVAIALTWLLNRSKTFVGQSVDPPAKEFLRYLAASLIGAMVNLTTMSAVSMYGTLLWHIPAYVAGAITGMIANYLLYNNIVFHGRNRD